MTLPFPKDDNKKKYQCFVCGKMFHSSEEFKKHILESHEEGRDFILCPLSHCGCPVRDLRVHFNFNHKQAAIPKNTQMKAIVWKDIKGNKVKTKKMKFREGWYESTKMNKKLHYRSGYECTVYECLDSDPDVVSFEVEPFKIPYFFEGSAHDYIPDLFVVFANGKKEIWEIKPASQTLLEKNEAKWIACGNLCKARGWELVVQTEKGIEKLKKKIRLLKG